MTGALTSANVTIERLNSLTAALFNNLTFRAYQHVLYGLWAGGTTAGFGAYVDGKAAGLVLAEVIGERASLLSICVSAPFRGHGLGSLLLDAADEWISNCNAKEATFTYVSGKAVTPAVERMLEKCGWAAPEPKHLVCTADKSVLDAEWFSAYKLPETFEVVAWTDVTEEDRARLRRSQEEENWIPHGLSPFDFDNNFEPVNSLAVKYKGEIVGWIITQRREPDSICYACSWMRPDLQRRGRLVAAYAEAVRRQVAGAPQLPYGIWIVPFKHGSMAHFVQRRMAPMLISLAEFRSSKKIFPGVPSSDRPLEAMVGAEQ